MMRDLRGRQRAGRWIAVGMALWGSALLGVGVAVPLPVQASSGLASGLFTHSRVISQTGLSSVSCASAQFCVAMSPAGQAVIFNGTRWSKPQEVDPSGLGESVSCPTASFCMAGDRAGRAFTYDGHTWSTPVKLGSPFDYVSCSTASFCASVSGSNHGQVRTFNGTRWSPTSPLGMIGSAISCARPAFCAIAGGLQRAQVVTFDGNAWSAPRFLDGGGTYLLGMSCPTSRFCMGVENRNLYVIFNGAWSRLKPTRLPLQDGAIADSCSSATFCTLVSWMGRADFFNGSRWSASTKVDRFSSPNSISCTSPKFCVLVDDGGRAFW